MSSDVLLQFDLAAVVCLAATAVGLAICGRDREWCWTAPAVGFGALMLLALLAADFMFSFWQTRNAPDAAAQDVAYQRASDPVHGGRPVQFHDVWPLTADRKIDLCPSHLDDEAPLGLYGYQKDPATPEFPLALISPASERTSSALSSVRVRKGTRSTCA